MTEFSMTNETLDDVMSIIVDANVDITKLSDLVYHNNKSIGLTFVNIRKQIATLNQSDRDIALENFMKVIKKLKSPNLFINVDN
tara:strand:+ start:329 stop:580 length:252 start_codon:yes stop_codon:yes gene_type:complete